MAYCNSSYLVHPVNSRFSEVSWLSNVSYPPSFKDSFEFIFKIIATTITAIIITLIAIIVVITDITFPC